MNKKIEFTLKDTSIRGETIEINYTSERYMSWSEILVIFLNSLRAIGYKIDEDDVKIK